MKKRLIAVAMTAVMLLGVFAGCSKSEKPAKDPAANQTSTSKYAYKASFTPLTAGDTGLDITYINRMAVFGDQVYYLADCEAGEQEERDSVTGEPILDENGNPYLYPVTETVLLSMNLTDGTVKRVEGYQQTAIPEGYNGHSNPGEVVACEDGSLWIVENQYFYFYDLPEGFDPEKDDAYQYEQHEQHTVCKQILPDGTAGKEIKLEEGESPVSLVKILSDGTIYGTDWSNLYRFDESGKMSKAAAMEGIDSLLELPNHQIAACIWGENGRDLRILNQETMTFGDPVVLPERANQLMDCAGTYDYLYEYSGSIYGNTLSGQPEKLLNWMDSDVDPGMINNDIKTGADGKIYALSEGDMGAVELITMTPVDPSTLPERQILTMACMFLPWDVRSEVVEFNKSQDQIRIVMKDYSEFGTEENPEGGIQKLNTEMISGVIPDLFYLNSDVPAEIYGVKGFLMDLWPMIDSDPELSRDDLMVHFFDTIAQDGKLYEITDRFSINTAVALNQAVGERESWNLQELMEAYKGLETGATIFGDRDTKDGILYTTVYQNLNAFIDWEKKTCSFNSQEFSDLLEFVNQFPNTIDEENYDWNNYQSPYGRMLMGKQLLKMEELYSFDSLMQTDTALKGNVNYIGYPTMSGCGSSFNYDSSFAIGAKCKNPEAAWKFIRQYLTEDHFKRQTVTVDSGGGMVIDTTSDMIRSHEPEYQTWLFPTNKKVFDEIAKYYLTETYYEDPETGEKVPMSKSTYWPEEQDAEPVEIYSMRQEVYDRFMELYERIDTVGAYNAEVADIITQECKAFFAGQKSAKDTAQVIQDRVSLYVAEQA